MESNHHIDLCIDNACSERSVSVATALMHPDDVMGNPALTRAQKREILASWASDARAVPNVPALRQLDNGAIVRVDDIFRALNTLDEGVRFSRQAPGLFRSSAQRQRKRSVSWWKSGLWRSGSSRDDDDDPPPCPAVIARPPRGPLAGGESVNPMPAMAA